MQIRQIAFMYFMVLVNIVSLDYPSDSVLYQRTHPLLDSRYNILPRFPFFLQDPYIPSILLPT